MRLTYDFHSFWFQVGFAILWLLLVGNIPTIFFGGDWRNALWLTQTGTLLLFFVFNMLLVIFTPTITLHLEARKAIKGLPVVLSSKDQAHRAKRWVSPVPWHVWTVLGLLFLLVISAWTDLFPRLWFGYRGTLGQGLYAVWNQEVSPDGRWLALAANPTSNHSEDVLAIVDRKSSETKTYPLPESARSIVWSSDGGWIATSGRGFFNALDVVGGRMIPINLPKPQAFSFHSDGSLWVLADDSLWRWDPVTRNGSQLMNKEGLCLCIKGSIHNPLALALSPDCSRLALSYGDQIRVLDTIRLNELASWKTPISFDSGFRFVSNDKIIFRDGPQKPPHSGLLIFNADKGVEIGRITGLAWHSDVLAEMDVSSDGRYLVAIRADHCIGVWSIDNHRWLWSVPSPTAQEEKCPRFSPISNELTTVGFSEYSIFGRTGRPVRRWHWKA